jgi:vitamin B12 transporter
MKQQFSSKTLVALICGAAITLSTAAFPQSNSTVSVTNSPNPMNPIIVTATRTPTKASDVLADNIYIGSEEIAQAGQTSLVELLQRQRGVEISNNGGPGSVASVYLRGTSNQQSLLLIDGVRSDSGMLGGPSWWAIPLSIIDHIEVIFGPQSSLYGSDAIGGVVQIFTKTGEGPMQVGASAGYGTYGTSISEASIFGSTGADKNTKYALSATQEISMGFNTIAKNNAERSYYAPKSLAYRTGYVKDGAAGKISHEYLKGQEIGIQFFAARNRSQYPGYNGIGNQINSQSTYTLFSKNQINENWKSLLQASQSYDLGQDITTTGNPIANTKQNIYNWQNDFKIGFDTLQILAERRVQSVFTNQPNYNTSYLPEDFSQTRNTNSVAAMYQLARNAHLANFAIRNDNISGYGSQNTGSASYGYFFTKEWRANINYGTGFRAPTFNDLYYPGYGNQSVQAEKSKNTEVGLQYETRIFESKLAAYSNTISNLIQGSGSSATGCPAGTWGQSGCAINVSAAKITGISFGNIARIGHFNLRASFDQQNPVNEGTGTVLAKRAKQFGNAGIEYQKGFLTSGVEGTFSGRRSDSYPADAGMGGYAIFNLYGSYEFSKDWTLFGRWNNVMNKDYQLTYGYNTPGSNVFAGIRYAMK